MNKSEIRVNSALALLGIGIDYNVEEDKNDGLLYNVKSPYSPDYPTVYTVQVWKFDDGVIQYVLYDREGKFLKVVAVIPFGKYEITNLASKKDEIDKLSEEYEDERVDERPTFPEE